MHLRILSCFDISNNYLGSHCCNNVFQRWSLFPLLHSVFQRWSLFPLLQQCVPTMISVPIVATMCSNDCLGSHCCNSVFQRWSRFPLLQQCVPKMVSVPTVATMCSNDGLDSHCCNSVSQQWSRFHCCNRVLQRWSLFPLLQQCVPTMTPGRVDLWLLKKKRDRQIWTGP
jgi:hypothetical protein